MRRNLVAAGRFLKRWRAFAIPLGLVLVVAVFTLVTHAVESPNVTDHDYLNPGSRAGIGGATLADQLTAHGTTVITENTANGALIAAAGGDATLFVPAPSLLNSRQLGALTQFPASVTVVVVAPDRDTIAHTDFPVSGVDTHWATHLAQPDCDDATANAAGPAGIDGAEYRGEVTPCYHGALVQLLGTTPRVLLAGASDVFRNDRIGEAGNQALALGLLSTHQRMIWLDIHDPEPPPPLVRAAAPDDTASPEVINEGGGGGDPAGGQNQLNGGGDGSGSGQTDTAQHSIARLFPSWLWTTAGLVGLIMVVFALAAARRMGPPVTEPMPVSARLRESVEGRGRLYRRAKQPALTLDVLRQAAVGQLAGLLGMPASTPVRTLSDMVAERTGLTRKTVDGILRDDQPTDNDTLVIATRRLDELMALLADSVGAPHTHTHGTDQT